MEMIAKLQQLNSEILIGNKSAKSNLEQLLRQLAKDLKLVGIIGLKNNVNVRDTLVLEELEKNGLKTWLLSQKKAEKSMASYYGIDLFDNYRKPFEIQGLSERQIEDSLKMQLKGLCERLQNFSKGADFNEPIFSITNRISGKKTSKRDSKTKNKKVDDQAESKKNCVVIKGQQLYLILKDETLLMLFFTLTSFCSLVICNEIDPIQRATLVEKLKTYNYKGGKGSVMAVVSSSHDRFMIKSADVSISL